MRFIFHPAFEPKIEILFFEKIGFLYSNLDKKVKVNIPPIKSQGIKTKLVPWINSLKPADFEGVWIEPFMGTGVVAFNIAPQQALLCDTNLHLINFYKAINEGSLTP
ncbi:D12 class N6 adenine-specific DNA methyltransferase domain protein [Candidatus Thiomargarita nelsonii]|uniref:D12 class N6 adenine-specific DNA methyltransferase domain protein n=1 Tax=Candidatus Thiomargarita nelsonii TaxID=1003181 RepID=A0A176RTS9_9GAMM|nr:D12 class N6 adenine-specific DNA methyltransferase domain protein [Candidatus Thiomargarita nelsonii]